MRSTQKNKNQKIKEIGEEILKNVSNAKNNGKSIIAVDAINLEFSSINLLQSALSKCGYISFIVYNSDQPARIYVKS